MSEYQVDLILDKHTPYQELQLAVLESQIQDVYDQVKMHVQHEIWNMRVKVTLEFSSYEDLIHWHLSNHMHDPVNMEPWSNFLFYSHSWKVAGPPQPHNTQK